jgi:hypothetical protein
MSALLPPPSDLLPPPFSPLSALSSLVSFFEESSGPWHSGYISEDELLNIPELAISPLAPRVVQVFQNLNFKDFVRMLAVRPGARPHNARRVIGCHAVLLKQQGRNVLTSVLSDTYQALARHLGGCHVTPATGSQDLLTDMLSDVYQALARHFVGCHVTQRTGFRNVLTYMLSDVYQALGSGLQRPCDARREAGVHVQGRGLHSSTIQFNVSASCGIGGAFRGRSGGVYAVYRGCPGVSRGI